VRNLKCFLPLVVVITAVLLAFSVPADAKGIGGYAGNHPLTIYEHGAIHGGLVYETVTDGSVYTPLQAMPEDEEEPLPILVQQITISIPEGATVKMARLYNYYCWSTSDRDDPNNLGMPAEADMWFGKDAPTVKKVCKHGLADGLDNRNSLPNPINYGNGVIHYWDTKGQNYTSKIWDFPSGAFAWDVTNIVTGNGTYVAKIQNNDSTPTAGLGAVAYPYWERIVPFGFGLLVVYEKESTPEIEYWIAEGCDYLMAQSWETFENTTTSATFGGVSGATDANLTTVWTHTEGGNSEDWDASQNMMYFNSNEIGPSTSVSDQAIGLNYFDVTTTSGENVLEFQDRNDDSCVHNAFLVVEYKLPDLNITEKFETLEDSIFTVTYTVKNIGEGDAGASTTSIKIDGTEEETDSVPGLASNASYTKTVGPFDCPCDQTLNITVCADNEGAVEESDEDNNCRTNELVCSVCMPDLVITEKKEEWVSLGDKTYNITYTVKNIGNGDAGASTTSIKIDGIEEATDSVPALTPDASHTATLGPFTITGNSDTIEVCADKDNAAVSESDETNNCKENIFTSLPDLTITDKSEEWVSLENKTYNITYTIKNEGDVKANASKTCIYIDDSFVMNDSIGELAVGEIYTNELGPFTMAGEEDKIKVCADCEENATESDEGNNCKENVFEYPKPDLKVTKKSETWVSKEDKTYTVTYTVKNIGGSSAGASMTSIKMDGTKEVTDAVLELGPGESHTATVGPFTMTGDSDTIRVCADKDNAAVSESDEGNNCKENVFEMPTSTTKMIPAGENGTVEGPAGSDTTVNVSASGDVNVTVEYYSDNPHPGATKPDNMVRKYIDISVDNAGNVSWPMYVEMHYTNGEIVGMDDSTLGLYHYKAGAWHRCSNTGVNVDENYVWAYVKREECSGSPFASGGPTPPVPVPEYNVAGLIALISVLSVVLAAVMGKRRRE
jgi:subtilase family serine protease